MGQVETEIAPGDALTIWLDNAGRRNALDQGMIERLVAIFERELSDGSVKVAIIRGRERNFCAGRDVSDIAAASDGSVDMATRLQPVRRLALAMRASPVPTVAMVEGLSVGLGVAMMCWCDFAVCAASASFSIPEARIGIPPSFTAMSLTGIIAPNWVRDMIVTGRRIDAQAALTAGLVTRVFADAAEQAGLDELVAEIARCNPTAVARGRQLLRGAGDLNFAGRIDAAYAAALGDLVSDEVVSGINAFRQRN